ncbi:uncharacterized protein MELLADRAFT_101661 [Melampsora larici-populina 98AG31]|uniref:Uncharacterized protein n=1 Tax=Melampsora larici-populina (strain 98AG31 / pathotype 3-4-7) TaxID=747676 RepID=F4R6K1_MELLP|nr:uncharacterized protein MELLADRAFT_101661 [Melampsora larici-populina 98AG31]EGG11896.1 hypothetical protein MELLADRAFT_101661 [Melampsora larici-populina 98AG31]
MIIIDTNTGPSYWVGAICSGAARLGKLVIMTFVAKDLVFKGDLGIKITGSQGGSVRNTAEEGDDTQTEFINKNHHKLVFKQLGCWEKTSHDDIPVQARKLSIWGKSNNLYARYLETTNEILGEIVV